MFNINSKWIKKKCTLIYMLNGYKAFQNSAFTGSMFTKVTLDCVPIENIMEVDFFLAVTYI